MFCWQMTVLGHWLTDCALAVYAMSQARNDFFLIHGVTAAWSLCQILPVFADQTEAGQAEAMKAIRVFVCGLIAVYVAQGCPALTESQLDVKVRTWEQIISDALSRDCDEHIYKLVQVCHERSVENKELKMAQLYLKAAQVALDHPLIFGGEPTKWVGGLTLPHKLQRIGSSLSILIHDITLLASEKVAGDRLMTNYLYL